MLDTVIIGAGVCGLSAYFYTCLYKLSATCIGDVIGGKTLLAPHIIDLPGIESTTGQEYVNHLLHQLETIQAQPTIGEVTDIRNEDGPEGNHFSTKTNGGQVYTSKTVIIAAGNGNKQRENRGLKLANQLGIATERGLIKPMQHTNTSLKGVYACGDCILYPTSLEQLTTAVSTGVSAAAAVYEYINNAKPPIVWGNANIRRM